MMRPALLGAALTVLTIPAASGAQVAPPHPPTPVPTIAVTGEGEARAVPDRGYITMGIETRAPTAAAAAAGNARTQRAILDTLRAIGFASEQLTTANYSVQPEIQYDENGRRPRVIGYVVSNTVRVDLRRIDQAGQVIDAALAKGANTVHGLSFYLSDPAPSRRAAIVDAVARARADADALASAAGGTLGELIELSTSAAQPSPVMYRRDMAAVGAAAGPTPIEPGEEVVRASVNARWAFVPRQ